MKNYEIYSKDKNGCTNYYFKDLKTNISFNIPNSNIISLKELGNSEYIIIFKPYKEYIYYHLNFKNKNKIVFRFFSNKVEKINDTYIVEHAICGTSKDEDKLKSERTVIYNPNNRLPLKCDFAKLLNDNNILCANCMKLKYDYEKDTFIADDILYYIVDKDSLRTDKIYSARKNTFKNLPELKNNTYENYLKTLKRTITRFYNENYKPFNIKDANDIVKIYKKK